MNIKVGSIFLNKHTKDSRTSKENCFYCYTKNLFIYSKIYWKTTKTVSNIIHDLENIKHDNNQLHTIQFLTTNLEIL